LQVLECGCLLQEKKDPHSKSKIRTMFKIFTIGKKLILGSVIIVLIFLAINTFSFINLNLFTQQSDLEKHTFKVLTNLEQILTSLIDAETGQRGYILTGQTRYLEPYDRGIVLATIEINDVKDLTSDNPKQQQKIIELKRLITDKVEELQETIDLRAQDKVDAAIAIVLSDRGKDLMDNIRNVIDEMEDEESRLLRIREQESTRLQTITEITIIFGSLMGLVFAMTIALVIANSIVEPIIKVQNAALEVARGNLDKRVEVVSRDEIGQFAVAFNQMADKVQEAYSEARRLPENILRSMKDSLFVVDTEGKITEVNQAVLDQLGYTKEELIGKPINTVFHKKRAIV